MEGEYLLPEGAGLEEFRRYGFGFTWMEVDEEEEEAVEAGEVDMETAAEVELTATERTGPTDGTAVMVATV